MVAISVPPRLSLPLPLHHQSWKDSFCYADAKPLSAYCLQDDKLSGSMQGIPLHTPAWQARQYASVAVAQVDDLFRQALGEALPGRCSHYSTEPLQVFHSAPVGVMAGGHTMFG
jgi:hypothetical protein